MNERVFTLQEIEEAIEVAKGMVIDADLDDKTKIIQMAGYIRRHLLETPPRKQGEAKEIGLCYDKNTGFIGEGGGT